MKQKTLDMTSKKNILTRIAAIGLILFTSLFSYTADAATVYARQDGDWDAADRWSTAGVGGASCSCMPGVGDSVVIDGYDIDIDAANVAIDALYITNARGNTAIVRVQQGYLFTVVRDVEIYHMNNNKNIELRVQDDSEMDIQGDLWMERIAGNKMNAKLKLRAEDYGYLNVDGNVHFQYNDAGTNENDDEIRILDNGRMDVGGDFSFNLHSGEDMDFNLDDSGYIHIVGDMIGFMNGGDDVDIDMDDQTQMIIDGDVSFTIDGGDDFKIFLGSNAAATTAMLNIGGDLTMYHDGGDDMYIGMVRDATMTVDGNISMEINGTNGDELYIDMKHDATMTVSGSITFDAEADDKLYFDMQNDTRLNLAGNFVRNAAPNDFGRFDQANNATLHLNGSAAQIIAQDAGAGNDEFTYQIVEINNTFGTSPQLTMEGDATINDHLEMMDGVILLGSSDLIIEENTTINGGSIDTYIDATLTNGGVVRKMIGGLASFSTTFPLGDVDDYSPMTFDLNSVMGGTYLTYAVADSLHPDLKPGDRITRWWRIDSDGFISIDYDVSYTYVDADISGTEANLFSARWDGASWTSYQPVTAPSNNLFTISGITQIPNNHDWSAGNGIALPVELVTLTASAQQNEVFVNWETAFEVDNSHFRVERSLNGFVFEEIGTVQGNGTTYSTSNYTLIDNEPYSGVSYYRIVQVDFDGKETEYGPLSVTITNSKASVAKLYPNPIVAGQSLTMEAQGIEPGAEVLVVLYDHLGREMYSKVIIAEYGFVVHGFDISQKLPTGVYLITGTSNNKMYKQKLVITNDNSAPIISKR